MSELYQAINYTTEKVGIMGNEKREWFCDPSTAMEDQKLESQFESNADQLEQQLEITEGGKKQTAF